MFSRIYISPILIFTFFLFINANAATYVVDRADDSALATACTAAANDCSLRGALTDVDANGAGADIINFNIPGGGVKTINITSKLPQIETSLTINGATQPGYFGKPLIEINGDGAFDSFGLDVETPAPYADISVTIIALALNRHTYGVYSRCPSPYKCDITLLGNFIGTDPTGTIALGNGGH